MKKGEKHEKGFIDYILGICIGTYASIFIGTPVMYDATMWDQKRLAAKKGNAKSSKK